MSVCLCARMRVCVCICFNLPVCLSVRSETTTEDDIPRIEAFRSGDKAYSSGEPVLLLHRFTLSLLCVAIPACLVRFQCRCTHSESRACPHPSPSL